MLHIIANLLRALLKNNSLYEKRREVVSIEILQTISPELKQSLLFEDDGKGLVLDKKCNLYYELKSAVGYNLFYKGSFEADEINFFYKKLKAIKNPLIIDIGANIGTHSIAWAKKLKNIQIYAFEPSPSNLDILQKNISINNVKSNIFVIPYALSDREGTFPFYQFTDGAFNSLKDTKRKPIKNIIEILVSTLDNFVAISEIKKIDLIKIDVEGFESEVIKGGFQTIKRFAPDLFVEIYQGENSNINPQETINTLISIGYKVYIFKNGIVEKYEKHSDSFYNYYFTTKTL